jgi:hypothetical protein
VASPTGAYFEHRSKKYKKSFFLIRRKISVRKKDILTPVMREYPLSQKFRIFFPKKILEDKMKDTIKKTISTANLSSSLKIR